MIEFASNGHTTPGYLAVPEEAGRYPGLIVIQEWWGLVPHIKDVADRFAGEGFIALAPDLYHGQATSEPDEARKLSMELDRQRAVAEILAALVYLKNLEEVAPKKIGVVGFCMGGSLAVATAAASQEVGAAVVFYGMPRDMDILQTIQAPLLGLYGEQDHGIPVDQVRVFETELQKHGIEHEVHIYPGAGHAFFNDSRPRIYQPQAAEDAWQRTLRWFSGHLVAR
jgi:carboxymethylenebutenolidase